MRKAALASLVGAIVAVGLVGCSAGAAGSEPGAGQHTMPSGMNMPSGRHTMPDGTVMGGTDDPSPVGSHPSSAATMICNDDTAVAVQHTFALTSQPQRASHWADQTYQCVYGLPGGPLTLSVKDLHGNAGNEWFDALKGKLPDVTSMNGMQNLGFPAFETSGGDVVFLKDGKTLWVDATSVPQADLPAGITRTGAAYNVAAAVLACWKG